jgi:hypothetical protein
MGVNWMQFLMSMTRHFRKPVLGILFTRHGGPIEKQNSNPRIPLTVSFAKSCSPILQSQDFGIEKPNIL